MLTLEELTLLQENNKMLKKLCDWVDKHDSSDYQNNEDIKNLFINLIANALINGKTNNINAR